MRSRRLLRSIFLYLAIIVVGLIVWPIRSFADVVPTLKERSYYVTGSKNTLRSLASHATTLGQWCGVGIASDRPWNDALARLFRNRPKAVDILLADTDPRLRRSAVRTIINMEDPSQCPRLVSLLEDKDFEIRRGATRGLGYIKSPEAERGLILATSNSSYEVRGVAAEFLTERGVPFDLKPIVEAAREDWETVEFPSTAEYLDASRGSYKCAQLLHKLRKSQK